MQVRMIALMLGAFILCSCDSHDSPTGTRMEPPDLVGPMIPAAFLMPHCEDSVATAAHAFVDSLVHHANSVLALGAGFFAGLPSTWIQGAASCWSSPCSTEVCRGTYDVCLSGDRWHWQFATHCAADSPTADTCWVQYEASCVAGARSGVLYIFRPREDRVAFEWTWWHGSSGGWQWVVSEDHADYPAIRAVIGTWSSPDEAVFRFIWRPTESQWDASVGRCQVLTDFSARVLCRGSQWLHSIHWNEDGSGWWTKQLRGSGDRDSTGWQGWLAEANKGMQPSARKARSG